MSSPKSDERLTADEEDVQFGDEAPPEGEDGQPPNDGTDDQVQKGKFIDEDDYFSVTE